MAYRGSIIVLSNTTSLYLKKACSERSSSLKALEVSRRLVQAFPAVTPALSLLSVFDSRSMQTGSFMTAMLDDS